MQQQIANYIHGKLLEILIVGVVTYIIFLSFGLNYPLLLSVVVGLSVLVPYIGAVLVTIPVALVAMFQFGISPNVLVFNCGLCGESTSRWKLVGAVFIL